MQEIADSRQQAEEELKRLRSEENELLDSIDKNDGSMKDKIIRLAEVMEHRLDLGDQQCTYLVHEISTQITRSLRSLRCPIAPWVHDYLPEKYKNPDLARWGKLAKNVHEIAIGTVLPRQPLEECSIATIETTLETMIRFKKENGGNIFDNQIDLFRRELVDRGVKEAAGEKYRDPISARDYRFEIPNDAELAELNNEVVVQMRRVIHEYEVFVENFIEYPGYTKEDARKWGNAARTYANMMAIVNEKKWSGEIDFWLDRNYWKKSQSSHKSGNSTFFDTTLCGRCSKNIDEDPKDFHVTKYDKTSPTGYRCDNCGSFEIDDRFNSREQVGDKSPEIDRMASDIVNHLEYYVDIFKDWRQRSLNPAIYARKRAISERFRRAAFGKDEIVVPRKKNK